jgi:hypothetical protein
MTRRERWVVAVGLLGTLAGVAAAGLFWLVLTRPVALALTIHGIL